MQPTNSLNSTTSALPVQSSAAPVSNSPLPLPHQPSTLTSLAPEERRTLCQRIKDFFSYLWSLLTRLFQGPANANPVETPADLEYSFYLGPYKALISQYKNAGKLVSGTLAFYGAPFYRSPGYVGMDKTYAFGNTLKLLQGHFINVSQEDLLCLVSIQKGDQIENRMLPSSLFTYGLIGNKVYFIDSKQDVLYRLDLAATFKEDLELLGKSLHDMKCPYEHHIDIPPTYHKWGGCYPVRFLSPQAKRIGGKGVSPLDVSTLKEVPSDMPLARILYAEFKDEKHIYMIEACGNPHIDIILDGRVLYAHMGPIAQYSDNILAGDCERAFKGSLFCEFCADKGEEIVKEEIAATLDDTGILTIEIPIKTSS